MKTKTDIVYGCDMYNFQITGDVAAGMNANSGLSANHAGPTLLILNDQGGSVMDVSEDITSTLRAQDHGHPPVVCFEPGILRRDCSAGNRAYIDICSTLRAQMGDNQPAVCYALDHVITTGANCTAQGPCVYENICPTEKAGGVHAVCYAVYPGNSITSPYNGNNPQPGDPCPTLTDDSRYYLVGEKHEQSETP